MRAAPPRAVTTDASEGLRREVDDARNRERPVLPSPLSGSERRVAAIRSAGLQQLHLVGFTTDLDGLIFSARKGAKSGSFVVPLDDKLVATIAEAHRRRNGDDAGEPLGDAGERQAGTARPRASRQDSRLTPRDIQARLRNGRTIEEVAREAAVDTDWVERWAAPVLAEQQRVVARARGLVFAKARGGTSVEPLGRSVAWNVADKGVWMAPEQFDRAWSAYQSLESWIVRFRYRSRGREHIAEWEVDGDELLSLDRIASQLAYLDRARRRKAPPRAEIVEDPEAVAVAATVPTVPAAAIETDEEEEEAPARPTKSAARRRTAARKRRGTTPGRATARRVATRKSAKKAPGKKSPAKKSPAKKSPAKKVATKKAATTRSSARKATKAKKATKAPARKASARRAPARKATRSKKASGARKAARRPPVEVVAQTRTTRARQAASDMLRAEPDLTDVPRFGTPGNPPATRRSGAGGKRTVVRAKGRKTSAAPAVEPLADAPIRIEPVGNDDTQAVAPVPAREPLPARPIAQPEPSFAPSGRRPGRRPLRLRATVRRRERDVPPGADVADVGDRADEPDFDEPESSVVPLSRGDGRRRPLIAAERAGDLMDQAEAADVGDAGDDAVDASSVFAPPAGGDADTSVDAGESAPPARRRRRLRGR
jgi:hypothetical protein